MRFIDEAVIDVKAGHGGPGCRSFRREKFIPLGGPDGGNGGSGGSVIFKGDRNLGSLLDFRFKAKWEAEDGSPGQGSCKDGRWGEDLVIHVPVGTEIFKISDGERELVADIAADGMEFIVAKGGRGGKGNTFFKSSTNQAPEHTQPGEEGERAKLLLSLKLFADVGLIGFPNAGKSTLISRISAARPKIADYPFTTLVPNLGVVKPKSGRTFVVADIPGLIPGAHEGKGLGIRFLKHVERTKILAHLIDPFATDDQGNIINPLDAFVIINSELRSFSDELAAKPQIVVLTKMDLVQESKEYSSVKEQFEREGYKCFLISSATGLGIEELVEELSSVTSVC